MSALMQRLPPEGEMETEAAIAQLKRREMVREKAAYAAARGRKTDGSAMAAEEKEKKRLVDPRRPRTMFNDVVRRTHALSKEGYSGSGLALETLFRSKINRAAGRVIKNPLVSVTIDLLTKCSPSFRANGVD